MTDCSKSSNYWLNGLENACNYTQESVVNIEETLIPFRSRLNFKKYLPGKLHKLCSPTSFTLNIQLYAEKWDKDSSFGHAETKPLSYQNILDCVWTIYADKI